uniref:Uncharacterized protein n=1 Tax=Haemonchus contortus TaxID=6289 RepID=A0A7I4XYA8_HAECO|nr:unnamed protein product [Haemonchus contortus]
MGLLPRTMIQCLLWCYVIAFYLSRAEEVKRERLSHCYKALEWSADHGVIREMELDDGEHLFCFIRVLVNAVNGTITSRGFRYSYTWQFGPEPKDPVACDLLAVDGDTLLFAIDEDEFSRYDGRIEAECLCNQSAICATRPETFESYLDSQRSNLKFHEKKAAGIISKFLRKGLLPNNAIEALEEFRAPPSTPTFTTKATTTESSTTTETTTSTETTETSSMFAATSDYEHSETSTTSAYEDSSTATDMALFTTRETEVAEEQQTDSFLGEYGLVIAVAFGILLILAVAIIAYKLRKGKENEDLERAIRKRGTSKSKESKGTSKESTSMSKESTGTSKEGTSKSKEFGEASKGGTSKSKEFGEASKGGTSKSKEFGEASKGGTSMSKEFGGTSKEGSRESITSKTKESGSKEKKMGSKE